MATGKPAVRIEAGRFLLTWDEQAQDWIVKATDEPDPVALEAIALQARTIAEGYRYSPAHGHPPGLLPELVADALGGKVIWPPAPEAEKGVIE